MTGRLYIDGDGHVRAAGADSSAAPVLYAAGFRRSGGGDDSWLLPPPVHPASLRWVARAAALDPDPALLELHSLTPRPLDPPVGAREGPSTGFEAPTPYTPHPPALAACPGVVSATRALLPYQVEGVRWLDRVGGRGLLADEMGLGKTVVALAWLARHPALRPAVVVCPAGLKENWRRETARWLTARETTVVLDGTAPDPAALAGATVVIVNYDVLGGRRRRGTRERLGWAEALAALPPAVVIFDEAHYLQSRSSLRSRAAARLRARCVVGLTGTPMTSRPANLWLPMALIAPGLLPGWTRYTLRYCAAHQSRWGWDVTGSSNERELHERLRPVMLRRTKEQVLPQLPAKRRTALPLPLSATGAREYAAARADFLAWLARAGDPERVARAQRALALTRMEQLKQLAAAAKLPAALEWLAEAAAQEPMVVFARHRSVLDATERALAAAGLRTVRVDGSVAGAERQRRVDAFQEGRAEVFLAEMRAGGVGVTLTRAWNVAVLELPWVPADLDQAEDRCYGRVNDPHGVNVYYLLAQGTVEEDVAALLDAKRNSVARVIDGRAGADPGDLLGALLRRVSGGGALRSGAAGV